MHIMRNTFNIGMALVALVVIPASALAVNIEPDNGFLDQEKPDWIEAQPVPVSDFPTIIQEVRAANLLVHEEVDKLHISSPTYERAHRLLLQHLLMMERQLHFNPVALAKFNASEHPSRFTIDARNYMPGNPSGAAVAADVPPTIVVTGSNSSDAIVHRRYTGSTPSRRSIILAAEAAGIRRAASWQ